MSDATSYADAISRAAEWIHLTLDATGVLVIAAGAVASTTSLVTALLRRVHVSFTAARLELARYLALALEFQLAADLVETAISPGWDRLGQLAAVAAIRTALNYFLGREMREEREIIAPPPSPAASPPTT